MKPIRDMTQVELGAYIQSHFSAKGIDVVLSEGVVVAIYTKGRYVSGDLDLVNQFFAKQSVIKSAIEELGFKEVGRHFEHHDTEYFVEFPPRPLAIGEEYDIKIDEFEVETGTLRLISPTDCVKDRLVWYCHDGDRQCLSQAILVAQDFQIAMNEIREWSDGEGKLEEFEEIEAELQS